MTNLELNHKCIVVLRESADPVASHPSAQWAEEHLAKVLKMRGARVNEIRKMPETPEADLCLILSGPDSQYAGKLLREFIKGI